MPPFAEYQTYLEGIWRREWLTNHGPLVNELEFELKKRLGVDQLLFLSNGTIALQIAIHALDLKGEVITTPFSYVATTSSIVWEHCQPVMVDICSRSLNIDIKKIEQAITDKTTAIIATHVFGNPCDVDAINAIAKKYKLRVIYDAAHAFGTMYKDHSLLSYGDVATCSFHATKLFHTIEGGAVITADDILAKRMALMRNFGHVSATEFGEVGINGKNSELHAAMGLCNLKYVDSIIDVRKKLSEQYMSRLKSLHICFQEIAAETQYNYAYLPIILESEEVVMEIIKSLNLNNIYPRRYFFPSLSNLPYISGQSTPISEDISRRILCLPLYYTLSVEEIDMICGLVERSIIN